MSSSRRVEVSLTRARATEVARVTCWSLPGSWFVATGGQVAVRSAALAEEAVWLQAASKIVRT
jgi:hypothetical protein